MDITNMYLATPSCRISKTMTEVKCPVSKLLGVPEEYKIFGKVYYS
jgi:hypothetical protein